MRILITNDDGVFSPVLPRLVKWAEKYGEVTTVAPKVEQSGKSHAIDFTRPIEIKKVTLDLGVEAYSMDSTPADCVRYAVLGLKGKYDLVISGINRGFNLGKDIVYSGTVGAIFEGARLGIKGVAISTDPKTFDVAVDYLDTLVKFFKDNKLFELNNLYNVNIPLETKPIHFTKQGEIYFTDEFVRQEGNMFIQSGGIVVTDTNDFTLDTDCTQAGHVSITPLTADRTNHAVLKLLNK